GPGDLRSAGVARSGDRPTTGGNRDAHAGQSALAPHRRGRVHSDPRFGSSPLFLEDLGMRRLFWIVPLVAGSVLTGYLFGWPAIAPADPQHPEGVHRPAPPTPAQRPTNAPAVSLPQLATPPSSPELPITRITLYSNGVSYVQREGHVEGDALIPLAFPVQDVNDLLKSMVLQDLGGGHVSAVGYDSQDPIDKTLDGFAIQLAGNPSLAKILYQARGELVQVFSPSPSHSAAGKILGVEVKPAGGKDAAAVEILNLWCDEGVRSIPLAEARQIKFLNPTVEREVQRALEVLAAGHDSQKKSVSLHFTGSGKRGVRVGYVVESPLWRTSYRLLVNKDGKPFLQGWALVQNPTGEDWKDVRMALVSGRPISFKMDLYQPTYAQRR